MTSSAPAATQPASPIVLSRYVCPQCQAPVAAKDLTCPACGINLVWAATLAERRVLAAMPSPDGAPFPEAIAQPRFGEFLLRRGDITEDQLQAALELQRVNAALGVQPTVGQILFEMGR